MREGWVKTTLGEICEVVGGGTPSTKKAAYWDGPIFWVTPTDITGVDQLTLSESARSITEEGLKGSSAKLVPKDAVLVTTRATIGPAVLAGTDLSTNQGVTSLIPREGVDSRWLLFWVLGNQREFTIRGAGNTFPEISKASVKAIPVCLPPSEEQRRIADLLYAAQKAGTAAAIEADCLEMSRGSLTRALLETDGQSVKRKLGDVTSIVSGGAFPRAHQGLTSGEIAFLKVSDMNSPGNERRITSSANWVSKSKLAELKVKCHPVGTVIFPKVGAALKTEKRRILEIPAAFDNNVMGLIASEELLPDYLLLCLDQIKFTDHVQEGAVPSITKTIVEKIEIPVPDLERQREVVNQVKEVSATSVAAANEKVKVEQLVRSLSATLLTGEHEILASYDRFLEETANGRDNADLTANSISNSAPDAAASSTLEAGSAAE